MIDLTQHFRERGHPKHAPEDVIQFDVRLSLGPVMVDGEPVLAFVEGYSGGFFYASRADLESIANPDWRVGRWLRLFDRAEQGQPPALVT